MPRKRLSSKQRRDDVLSEPDGWLLFWAGWVYNKPPNRPDGFFGSIEDMKRYYQENKSRIIHEMGDTTDFWAFHAFEPHDWANCGYCQHHNLRGENGA